MLYSVRFPRGGPRHSRVSSPYEVIFPNTAAPDRRLTVGEMDSYADWVRTRSDEELRALFAERPELITPVPADLSALAARAATPAAVVRGLDRLDRFALAVVEALLAVPQPTPYDRLGAAFDPPPPG